MLGTEIYLQFFLFYFEMVLLNCPGWAETLSPPALISQVAVLGGMCHHALLILLIFLHIQPLALHTFFDTQVHLSV